MCALIRSLGAASLIGLAGCYHATIETGATPSTVVIDKSFASSWIYGLVPPSIVSTTSKCPSGVAKVETQHTFVNQLVGFLTLGIYTPMQIRVTCAGAGSVAPAALRIVAPGTSIAAKEEAFAQAVTRSRATSSSVYVEF